MLSKLSKGPKQHKDAKNPASKNQKSKTKIKDNRKPNKSNHHHQVSSSSLIKIHNQSQCSLISQPKKSGKGKKNKNSLSSMSLLQQPK